jgi:hypothetical protein
MEYFGGEKDAEGFEGIIPFIADLEAPILVVLKFWTPAEVMICGTDNIFCIIDLFLDRYFF